MAKIVVVNKSASTSNEDQVFIYDTAPQGTEKDGSTVIKYYNALVNGEDTTIGISDAGFNGTPAVGLYVNNSYTDEYISAMGDHFDATATDTATVIVTDQAAEGLSDVTLKNGIVTIDATADKTYVTADEFNSYIVRGQLCRSGRSGSGQRQHLWCKRFRGLCPGCRRLRHCCSGRR